MGLSVIVANFRKGRISRSNVEKKSDLRIIILTKILKNLQIINNTKSNLDKIYRW